MTLSDYLRLLRRGWVVLLALVLLGVGAASLATRFMTPSYGAVAQVAVTTTDDGTTSALQQGNDFSTQRAQTYAALATTTTVLSAAAQAVGDDLDELRQHVTVAPVTGTALINVTASGTTGQLAADRANAVAEALMSQATALDGRSSDSPLRLELATQAEVPQVADTPRPRNNVLIGAVVGLVLGIGWLIVTQALDTRIRSAADLPAAARLTTVTSLPVERGRSSRGSRGRVSDRRLESFRHLRSNLQFSRASGKTIAIAGVTSASDARGVGRQLSRALGEIGMRVVVVDVDLRPSGRAHDAKRRGAVTPAGVADVLGGGSPLDDVLRAEGADGVWEVPAGNVAESSAQLLSTSRMGDLIDALVERFDYVLLTCPPLVERSEAAAVAALSQSELVVVEAGATKRAELGYALELLAGVGVEAPSVALDGVRGSDLGRSAVSARAS